MNFKNIIYFILKNVFVNWVNTQYCEQSPVCSVSAQNINSVISDKIMIRIQTVSEIIHFSLPAVLLIRPPTLRR